MKICRHGFKDEHINAFFFPTQFGNEFLCGSLTHVGRTKGIRSQVPFADAYGVIKHFGVFRTEKRKVCCANNLLWYASTHACHANIMNIPPSHD